MTRTLLTTGDPNGIGPEIAVKAAAALGAAAPVVVGDAHVLQRYAAAVGLSLREAAPGAAAAPGVLDVVDAGALAASDLALGEVTAAAGAATIAYARTAVQLAQGEGYRAVVAGPHSETAVHAAGIEFAGYPPLIAELTNTPRDEVFLMLLGAGLRIVHTTLHISLSEALERLDERLITQAGRALHTALQAMGIENPKLGMFGINPHASEGGLFGDEDLRLAAPAAAALRAAGIDITDPIGADVLLGDRVHDGYLAMYHDQGHIPVKLLAGRSSAAVTIGAGVPFSSVGHGPAFDIAGTGQADPAAILAALNLFTDQKAEAVR
ncbi:PdxA family dehydrogenase [Glutamicibacter nicotianae]